MGHSYCRLLVHAVFSTKNRQPSIGDPLRDRLHQYMGGVAREEFGRALLVGGTTDHVHGLLLARADVSIADAMCKWKSLSSGWVHKTFTDRQDFAWQNGYGAFSVSESNTEQVSDYIRRQAEHHRKMTFEEEFLGLLRRHGIEYEAAHVLD